MKRFIFIFSVISLMASCSNSGGIVAIWALLEFMEHFFGKKFGHVKTFY